MKQVDLSKWQQSDKPQFKINPDFFIGTMIQSNGTLKGYTVQIALVGLVIPTKVVQTNEEAIAIEKEIWTEFEN